jgi:hypothetical protein
VFHQAVVLEKEAGLRVHKLESDEDGFYLRGRKAKKERL